MRFFVLLLLFSVLPLSAEVFFIPGWQTGVDSSRDGCVAILRDIFPGQKITVQPWDGMDLQWSRVKAKAESHNQRVLARVLALPENQRRDLIIVGHSVGANIAVEVLCELARRKIKIHSSVLLGGALPNDDPRIRRSLDAVRFCCCIVYNPDDWVLKYLYPLGEVVSRKPLGLEGWSGWDMRVFESRAPDERFGLFNHYAYLYLYELARLYRNLPEFHEVTVAQDEENLERQPGDDVFCETVESFSGWKLQKSVYSGKFRILDDHNIRRANGRESKMRESFAGIKEQLFRRK